MRTRALGLGIAIAALAAVCAVRRGGSTAPADVPVLAVKRGALVRKVRAEGNLKAAKATAVAAPGNDATYKIGWLIEDGSRVKKDDVLVRFDPTELEKELEAGKAEGATADRKTDKEKAESGTAIANLGRDAEQARRELEVSRTFQSKDPELWSRHEIIESDIDVELAGRRVENARTTRGIREEMSKASLEILAIDRRKAGLKIDKAARDLAQVTVRAPHDGIVVFRRDWKGDIPEIGSVVWSGFPLAEIPEVKELEAEVWVLESDVGGLAPGRPAKVVVEAHPESPVDAKIKSVDALAKPRMRGVPVQYFGVTLTLATDPKTMKPGQRVVATLLPGDEAGVLAVPRQAVFERDGKTVVFRRARRGFDAVEVKLGASSAGRVVVTAGLKEGDVVALRDPEKKTDAAAAAAAGNGTPR